jgi:hypothetical protein
MHFYFFAADPRGRFADNIKNDILDETNIFHADPRMKNGVMPCRQHLLNCILVHFGLVAVLVLSFLCRGNLRDVYDFMRF